MQQPNELYFEKIVNAATVQDLTPLNKSIEPYCIDEWKLGSYFFSAASQLALEGYRAAAEYLRSQGAEINYLAVGAAQGGHREYAEFLRLSQGAEINYLAQGAAQGGHREYAEFLRSQGADINALAKGAAMGGHREYAEFLRSQGADINALAKGAAMGGHREYAEFLRSQGADINALAEGAAMGGHREYAEFLRSQSADINALAQGAATGGHREYAEFLRSQGANINCLAQGAAQGGHREYAEFLRSQGANINCLANGAAQGGHREYAEFLRSQANINYLANGAAQGGHREYAEFLRSQSADINYLANGAAMGGHREYAEFLRSQGADINCLAQGAAMGGHREYAEFLRSQSANIKALANGAAQGGHRKYAEFLRSRGANINALAEGAAMGGHREYAEFLWSQGADINCLANGAAAGRRPFPRAADSQLAYLSLYPPQIIPPLTKALKNLNDPIPIEESTEKRAIAISKQIHMYNHTFPLALVRTDSKYQGMLYLLMLLVMKKNSPFPQDEITSLLSMEMWATIFNFVMSAWLDKNSLEYLGFAMGRTYLCAQLDCYHSPWWGVKNKDRSLSFFQAVSKAQNKEEMQDLISKQVQLLQRKNPYQPHERDFAHKLDPDPKSSGIDKFYHIVGFWGEMYTGKKVVFEEKRQERELCPIQ